MQILISFNMYITKLLIKIITIGSNLACGIRDCAKIAGLIKTEIYCQILIHHANLIINSLIFRYDNDPEHTVNVAKACLDRKRAGM